jgi:hypothetical protein
MSPKVMNTAVFERGNAVHAPAARPARKSGNEDTVPGFQMINMQSP